MMLDRDLAMAKLLNLCKGGPLCWALQLSQLR